MSGWLARGCEELPASGPEGTGWLSTAEQERLGRLRFPKRRSEFLLRRWTAKHAVLAVLGEAAGSGGAAAAARVAVLNRASGAPYVLVDGAPLGLEVSVTDRAGWAVCLVGDGPDPVGVDLELVEPRSDAFVADFLTTAEASRVRARPTGDGPGGRSELADVVWSAKESALKVLRTGLRTDTRAVEVTLRDSAPGGPGVAAGWRPLAVRHMPTGQVLPGWWRRDGDFVVTTAAVRPHDPPALLPTSDDLARAVPVDPWPAEPFADVRRR
ncbi:4'-phosphopantetheinyl transferase superfamily protein [Kineosporia sp. A_224]|uniref:4'-phosphopantetheinyl transferase family protein n=1 Tax=Kineosporia sp. A_224 TaxID=1962180 RepID=UPI000B4BB524|nr:4'-phosphopantetheinyl transferase family protein [Kineosporia sp. A_224]